MTAVTPPKTLTQLDLDLPGASCDALPTPAPRPARPKPVLPAYPAPEVRIDWFSVFSELKRAGWSMYRIESTLRIPKATLNGWKSGAEPKHYDGERFIQLWCDVTGQPRDKMPTERRMPSAYQSRR